MISSRWWPNLPALFLPGPCLRGPRVLIAFPNRVYLTWLPPPSSSSNRRAFSFHHHGPYSSRSSSRPRSSGDNPAFPYVSNLYRPRPSNDNSNRPTKSASHRIGSKARSPLGLLPRVPSPPPPASATAFTDWGAGDDDLQLATALSLSLAQQTFYDIPVDHRPLIRPAECIACTDTLPPGYFPSVGISAFCDHASADRSRSRICLNCLSEHLRVQLDSSGPNELKCPICHVRLEYDDVRRWASSESFCRYDTFVMRSAAQKDSNFVECSAGCGAAQFHMGGPESPMAICHKCGARTCVVHGRAWHNGLSCYEFDNPAAAEARRRREAAEEMKLRQEEEQYRREEERKQEMEDMRRRQEAEERKRRNEADERARRLQEERQGEALVHGSSKKCPGVGCSYRVTKIDGCKHITCEWPLP